MIVESSKTLLLLLGVLTLLGIVIGYCIAMLSAKRQAREAIESSQLELGDELRSTKSELQAAKAEISTLRLSMPDETEQAQSTYGSMNSQSQARIIHTLEAELSSLQDKQLRLQREFATYKSNASQELERARIAADSLTAIDSLPTLSRKVDNTSGIRRVDQSLSMPQRFAPGRPAGSGDASSYTSSREIDIPALAESELEDAVDALELDVSGGRGSGARGRG